MNNNSTPNAPRNSSSTIAFILILSLFIAARLWHLTSSCLWFDELFGIHAARHDWSGLIRFVAADIIHPPLFYLLLKVWISIGGESLLWLRLLPALISIATLVPFLLLCRDLKSPSTEINLALLLLAVNGYLIKYTQEVRMYSLLFFFSVSSLWLFIRFLKASTGARKQLLPLSALNFLMVFTHYYGWLVIAAEAVILLVWQRDKLRDFFIAVALLLLAFSPWVYVVTSLSEAGDLSQNIGWVERPHLSNIAQFLTLLSEPFYFRQSSIEPLFYSWSLVAGFFLLDLPLLALLWRTFRQKNQDYGQTAAVTLLITFVVAPLVLAFILSWLLPHSIWGTRHLIIVAVPYSFLLAVALERLRPEWIRTTVFILLGCWFFLAGAIFLLRRETDYVWCAWEQLAAQVIQQPAAANTPVSVYAFEDLIAYHLWFALGSEEGRTFKIGVLKGVPGLQEDPSYFVPRGFNDITTMDHLRLEEGDIWIAFRDFKWDQERPPLKTLTERGYQIRNVLETSIGGQRAFLVYLSKDLK